MTVLRDIKLALRVLFRSRGYTAAVVAVLALAIGANTAIFSTVHAVLLKPLPIRAPQDLVVVWASDPGRSLPVVELSYRMFEHWSAHSRSFESAAVIGSSAWPAVLQGRGTPVRLASTGVSASFFETLGASPLLGRTLRPDDDLPNAAPVAVLSYAAWVEYFGQDPAVAGSAIHFDKARTIVGVMPREFDFPRGTSVWFPVVPLLSGISRPDFDALESVAVLFMIGRLQPGVTAQSARDELDALATGTSAAPAPYRFGSTVVATRFLDYVLGPARQGLWALWLAVILVLVIACANVAGLMLTRVSRRCREHAVRAALGASRMDIARLWLIEATALVIAGGILGAALGWWMTKAIVAVAPADLPRVAGVTMSPAVVAFAVAIVLLTAAVCAVVPAREAGRGNLLDGLKDAAYGTAGSRTQRARSGLVIVQIALSVVLLVSAGLIVRSFGALRSLDVGFATADVLTMFVDVRSNEAQHELLGRVRALPRVTAAGAVRLRPLELGAIGSEAAVVLEGQTASAARQNPNLNQQVATPGFFDAAGIRLVRGRHFSDRDRAGNEPVAIVGETAARRLWPGGEALGRRILLRGQKEWRTIVGVVGDVHYRGLGDIRLDVYEPALQSSHSASYLAIRTSGDPLAIAATVQAEVRRFDSQAVVDSITTLEAIVSRAVAPWRFTSWVLAVLAAVAFLVTSVGLFGMVSLHVSNRRHELAIRLALGAGRGDLVRSVVAPTALHAVTGIAVGSLAAAFLTRALRGLLFGVQPLDPTTWIGTVAAVSIVAALAAWLPARRAAEVDPMMLLRR